MTHLVKSTLLDIAAAGSAIGGTALLREDCAEAASQQPMFRIPAPAFQAPEAAKHEIAVFAGGCF